MPAQAGVWKKGAYISLFVFILSFVYAFVRYNIVRNVPYDQIPFFISNKVFALSSVIIIGLSFVLGPLAKFWPQTFVPKLYLRKSLGVFGFGTAAVHAVISSSIISPAYYPDFFDAAGKINLIGETTLLFGILAFSIFLIVAVSSIPAIEEKMGMERWKSVQRFGYLAYFLVLLHVGVMDFKDWSDPEAYKYLLIPISLIASLFIIFVFLVRIFAGTFKKSP